MSDKIEYSRLILKRTTDPGIIPTIPTGTTLDTFLPTDLFVGELFLNAVDDKMWVRTDNGIVEISISGSTGSTPTLAEVLNSGNVSFNDIVITSGNTIQYQGLNTGSTTTILGLDASGNTITTSVAGATQDLDNVLSYGNSTGSYNIIVSSGQTIQYQGLSNGTSNTILALDTTGGTITTTISDGNTYITGGTITYIGSNGTLDLFDNSGSTISITGLTDIFTTGGTYSSSDGELTLTRNDGTQILVNGFFTGYTNLVETLTTGIGLSANTTTGNITIVNTGTLEQTLINGNITNGNDIVVSNNDQIKSSDNTNTITLHDSSHLYIDSTYTHGGKNYEDFIKLRASNSGDSSIELKSENITDTNYTQTIYKPGSISNYSYDTVGAYSYTLLDSNGFTIDLTNDSSSNVILKGIPNGTSTYQLGLDGTNNLIKYTGTSVSSLTTGTGLSANTTTGNITITNTIVNGSFGITIDGGGSAITTGVKGYITIPYDCTITGWDILADVSGSIVVDVWKDTYANFPPTVADTIAGSEKPTLSSAVKNQDNSLSTWTTSVSSGDIIGFNVDSASTLKRVNLTIKVLKTS